MKINVNSCARCGEDHEQIEFKKFVRPVEDSDGTLWNWWGFCPRTLDPILMTIYETDDEE